MNRDPFNVTMRREGTRLVLEIESDAGAQVSAVETVMVARHHTRVPAGARRRRLDRDAHRGETEV